MVPDRDKTSKLDPVEKTKQKTSSHSLTNETTKQENKETTVMGQFQLESEVLKGSHNSQSGSEIPRVTVPPMGKRNPPSHGSLFSSMFIDSVDDDDDDNEDGDGHET